jgi:lipoprotein-anchoring transpeptidase ErfK/SrfK
MMVAGGHGASGATKKLWRIAVLTAAGAIGTASHAEAAIYYWSDSDSGYSRPGPTVPRARQKPRQHQAKKTDAAEKESSKPQGPLIIAISIERQKLRIYDANGFFAETPISTGMKGHSTPMGVFSVIQKQKLHHSNIYSGAPMPYMQRITWSGIAIHAGVLPGYPASHGCIRMPMAFAIKMWNWTKMGARVVVTPGEMTPSSFSHPLLAAQKVVPQPAAANEPQLDAPLAAKSDKASDAAATIKPATSEANLELRSTVGHSDGVRSATDQPPASTALRDQTHTADASSDMLASKASVTMSDASGGNASPRDEAAAATDSNAGDAAKADVKSEDAAKPEAEPAAAKPGETASSEDKPVETKSSEAKTPEIKSAEIKSAATEASDKDGRKADEAEAAAPASGDAAKAEASSTGSVTDGAKIDENAIDQKKLDAKADAVKAEVSKPDAPKTNEKTSEKPDASVAPVTDTRASAAVKKDPARLPDAEKATAAKPDPAASAPKRTGQIAVFVSRKDSKLYVRQNFAPLFDVPVTIAPSDRPLGTHVFTAQVDKNDANVLHWSVVSLPVPARYTERRDEDDRALRRRRIAGAVEMKPMPVPDSPAEALDRLAIPADAMARITDALSTGASIIVSDQGINAGETGEGTDFIVSLR